MIFKRLDRYILRELIPPFFVASLVVLTMFQVNTYIYLGKTFDLSHVPLSAVLKLILYRSPEYMTFTFPIGIALATSIGMSRIARESELTGMRAAGIRVLRVIRPVVFFGLLVGLLNFYTVDTLMPRTAEASRKLQIEVGVMGSVANFQSNMPLRLKQYTVSLGQVERLPDDTLVIRDALLIERPQSGKVAIISAKDGTYDHGIWRFRGGFIRIFEPGGAGMDEAFTKDEITINEPISVSDLFNPTGADEIGVRELGRRIAEKHKIGQDAREDEIQYHVKLSVPFICVIFALVCPIFSISLAKHGGFIGVLVSLVVVMGYYNVWVVSTQILGKIAWVQPWQAAWIPNILLAIVGLYGLRRLE